MSTNPGEAHTLLSHIRGYAEADRKKSLFFEWSFGVSASACCVGLVAYIITLVSTTPRGEVLSDANIVNVLMILATIGFLTSGLFTFHRRNYIDLITQFPVGDVDLSYKDGEFRVVVRNHGNSHLVVKVLMVSVDEASICDGKPEMWGVPSLLAVGVRYEGGHAYAELRGGSKVKAMIECTEPLSSRDISVTKQYRYVNHELICESSTIV